MLFQRNKHTGNTEECRLAFFFFFKDFMYLFLERGREISVHGCLSRGPHWDLACNPGMCPDWESNRRPLGSQPVFSPLSCTSPGLELLLFLQFDCRPFMGRTQGFLILELPYWTLICDRDAAGCPTEDDENLLYLHCPVW